MQFTSDFNRNESPREIKRYSSPWEAICAMLKNKVLFLFFQMKLWFDVRYIHSLEGLLQVLKKFLYIWEYERLSVNMRESFTNKINFYFFIHLFIYWIIFLCV
jgi:hypothetical protein